MVCTSNKANVFFRSVWLVLGVCILATYAKAQKYVYSRVQGFENASIEVRGLVSDTLGYVWVISNQGITRNDGRGLVSFNHELRSHDLRSILYTNDDRILVSNDAGIVSINPYTSPPEFEMFLIGSESPKTGQMHYPDELIQDAQGRIWFTQANAEIGMIDEEGLRVIQLTGLCHESGSAIHIAECEGEIFVYGGGACMVKIDRSFEPVPVSIIGISEGLHSMTVLSDQMYFYGKGIQRGALTFNGEKITLSKYQNTAYNITALCQNENRILFAGTEKNGLHQVFINEDDLVLSSVYMANDPHRVEEIPDESIEQLYCTEDIVWLSSKEGLSFLQRRYFETITDLPNLNTVNIYNDETTMYVSMGNVYMVDLANAELLAKPSRMADNYSPNFMQRQGDLLWVSTTTGQLLGYRNERLIKKVDLSSRGTGIFNLTTDQFGNMWICQSPQNKPIVGLAKLSADGTFVEYGKDKGLENRILAQGQGGNGELYVAGIGENSTLYKYNFEQDSFYNLSIPFDFEVGINFEVHDLEVDQDGVVWLASTDGLIRYDVDHFSRVDLGIYTTHEIHGIAAVGKDNYWIATDTDGLLHYDGKQHVLLDEDSGLPSRIPSYRGLEIDDAGRLWAATSEGLVYTRSANPKPNLTARPMLTQVRCDRRAIKLGRRGSYLVYENEETELQFESIEYPGRSLEYRYRLEDKFGSGDWVSLGRENRLVLNDISRETRSIEISAMNHIGKAWSQNLSVPIRTVVPWFRTIWAYFLFGFMAFTMLWTLFRFNFSKLMKRIRKLESALAVSETEFQREKNEKIEDKHRLNLIFQLSEVFKEAKTEKDVIQLIGEAMDESFDIDLVEIGIYNSKLEAIHYFGHDATLDVITERHEPFKYKENIGAYALHHNEVLLFQDYKIQHQSFVSPEEHDHPYASQIIIPFELKDKRKAILHIGAEEAGMLLKRDVEMFFILTTMIDSIDITRDL